MNQDVKYDFTADLTGTGDRSGYEKKFLYSVLCGYGVTDKEFFYTCVR